MHGTLPPKGICSESCDLFKFLEITDVNGARQRHSRNGTPIRNGVPYRMTSLSMPLTATLAV